MKEALICLVAVHGDHVRQPCREMWKALRIEDEDGRAPIMYYHLERMQKYFRRSELFVYEHYTDD